jgi:hypothetical protein
MAQTAQDVMNALNGVTFGQGTLGGVEVASPAGGYNGAGGQTDVYVGATNALAGGYAEIAYINHLGSAGTVTGVHYDHIAAHTGPYGNYFASYGYITVTGGQPGGYNGLFTHKYYVHGFSQDGLLVSTSPLLTENDVNGIDTYFNSTGANGYHAAIGDSHFFEVLSMTDLGAGPNSPAYFGPDAPEPIVTTGGYTYAVGTGEGFSNYTKTTTTPFYDGAGIGHQGGTTTWSGTPNYQGQPYTASYHVNPNAFDGNPNPPAYPLVFSNDPTQFDLSSIPCYAEGVKLLTRRGEVAVEDLVVGDEAVLASGGARPVIWIGSRQVRCDRHPNPAEVNPVRIRKGAFGEGQPVRDLVLSPGHAVFVDGVLIPAHALINGATVVQEAVERVRYFHIELDAHDVLLAEGLPCESYLDDGNRTTFGNSPEFTALHGRLDPKSWEHACAPMVAGGPQLAEVQRRLLARAEAIGWSRVEEPGLRLLADGVAIAPVVARQNRYWFAAPPARDLALASTSSVLAYTLPGVVDARRLGVAVSELKIDGHALDLAGPAFGPGFHAPEAHDEHAWRWTDGHGRLALTLAEPAMLEVTLLLVAPTWKRPAVQLRLVEAG